ncbi:dipeptide/oligopeptide/nickel ABC transporter permease/ATP-binding protein [Niveispirillum sp. KHB5.9]|uniref:dipeptide/oligopeptide/nickel ABC transporter permease/ATP-binding protein n=1 Tax=Niveispirillum sp. KHB5.9 TaxID=3400269 RepID=UPI003A8B8418
MTTAAIAPTRPPRRQAALALLRDICASRRARVGLVLLILLLTAALLAPLLAPQNPYDLAQLDLADSHLKPGAVGATGMVHWLGTDLLGRDMLSGILYGLRTSLSVGLLAGLLAAALGTSVGLVAAYTGGRVDAAIMRLVDLQLSLPSILVALILLAIFGKGLDKIVLALVIVQWAFYARNVRATALSEAAKEYVEAARSLRLGRMRILFGHLLPNCLPPLIVIGSLQTASAISLEATLSFLGIGLPVTQPSLGLLIANGFSHMLSGKYWVSVFPGVTLLLLVASINLVGDQLRLLLNPRLRPQPLPPAMDLERPALAADPGKLLSVRGLKTYFFTRNGVVKSVDGVDFDLGAGEVLGLVGESGSGKSITGRSIMGLIDPPGRVVGGSVLLDGRELLDLDEEHIRDLRGREIAMIFQDPMMTLNPMLRIDTQMVEALTAHGPVTRRAAEDRAAAALSSVGIADAGRRLKAYPHQFSGGMRQRVAIATSMLHRPKLIIADEPTTALDVTVQAQILAEMQEMVAASGTSLVWITHDIGVVAGLADRIAVMYAGRIVEIGPADQVLSHPRHPYTSGLLDSLPHRAERGKPLAQVPGSPPHPVHRPPGCAFTPRCPRATELCGVMPAMQGDLHQVRCFHPMEGEP